VTGYGFVVGGESQPIPSEYNDSQSPIYISSDSSGLSLLFLFVSIQK